MPKCLQIWQFCMAKARQHRFRARKPLKLTKVGVAKHRVGGIAAPPTVYITRKLHPWLFTLILFASLYKIGHRWQTQSAGEPTNLCIWRCLKADQRSVASQRTGRWRTGSEVSRRRWRRVWSRESGHWTVPPLADACASQPWQGRTQGE